MLPERLYLDHAATTPMLPAAREAMVAGMQRWANPSSPHAEGRAARAALEDARGRVAAALGWGGAVILTSGATEALALAIGRAKAGRVVASPFEHEAVRRNLPELGSGRGTAAQGAVVEGKSPGPGIPLHHSSSGPPPQDELGEVLIVHQHVNSETGMILPPPDRQEGDLWLADCAQSAGKLPLPEADFCVVSAHKLGGPPGIGALLVRDLATLRPTGGQEQGYRGGTENLPAALGFAAALEQPRDWLERAERLRARLDAAIVAEGGEIVAGDRPRIATIASYRMPGLAAAAQLIRFDLAGIAVSAGSACSSGSLRPSPVLAALGWAEEKAGEVVRVSFGPGTDEAAVERFLSAWTGLAREARTRAA